MYKQEASVYNLGIVQFDLLSVCWKCRSSSLGYKSAWEEWVHEEWASLCILCKVQDLPP